MGVGLRQTETEHLWASGGHSNTPFLAVVTRRLGPVETCPSCISRFGDTVAILSHRHTCLLLARIHT